MKKIIIIVIICSFIGLKARAQESKSPISMGTQVLGLSLGTIPFGDEFDNNVTGYYALITPSYGRFITDRLLLKGGISILNVYFKFRHEPTVFSLRPGLEASMNYYFFSKKRSALFANAAIGFHFYSLPGYTMLPYINAGLGYNCLVSKSVSLAWVLI